LNFRDYKLSATLDQATIQPGETNAPTDSITSKSLKLKVSLNPSLQNELSPEAPVFVFVRAAENPGPPLAVVRKKVAELPFEIALNDSHAMIPGRTISSAKNVIVGARISVSGNPERQAGDFEKLSNSIPSNSDKILELIINDKI
jgi:cytochrome c-type biogenesis protein CcmH